MIRRAARPLVLSAALALVLATAAAGLPAQADPTSTAPVSPAGVIPTGAPTTSPTTPETAPETTPETTPSTPTATPTTENTPSSSVTTPATSETTAAGHRQLSGTAAAITLAIVTQDSPQAGVFFEDIGSFAFSGTVPGDSAGQTVSVCRLDTKTWTRVATATVHDHSWDAALPVTNAASRISFHAAVGDRCPGSTGSVSNQVDVAVRNAYVTMDKPVTRIDSLKNPVISGHVYPARAGVKINIDILRSDKAFRVTQQTTTDSKGHFAKAVSYGVGRLNTYTTRAAYRATNRNRWETSTSGTFTRIAVLDASSRPTTAADVAKTYRPGCPVGPSKLRTLSMNYYGLRDHKMHRGVIIIRSSLVDDLTRAFGSALAHRYPIAQMVNPNVYGGNDPRQMAADNTSGFNCRKVTGNPYAQSPHSYGTALDINTVENPYRDVHGRWWPSNGKKYIKRTPWKPGMITKSSTITKSLRKDHFFWGGFWNPGRDYQHFQR